MNLHKTIFQNISWVLIEKLSKAILTALTSLIVAKYLGADGLGKLSLVLAYYSIFTVISTLGLDSVVMREMQAKYQRNESIIGCSILLRLIGAGLGFVVVNVTVYFMYTNDTELKIMMLLLSCCFFLSVGNVLEVVYRVQMRSKVITILKTCGLLTSALVKIIVVISESNIAWFVLPVILETLVVSVSFVLLKNLDPQLKLGKLSVSRFGCKRLLKFSWPLLFSGLMGSLYFHFDKIIIERYLSSYELGKYALLFQLVSTLLLLFTSINMSVTPALNRLFFENEDKYWVKYHEVLAFKLLLAFGVSGIFVIFTNLALPRVIGTDFIYQWELLIIFACYILLVSIGSLTKEFCLLVGRTKPLMLNRAVTLIVNFSLNLYLIPKYGLVGAAGASLFSYFLDVFVLLLFYDSLRRVVLNNLLGIRLIFSSKFYFRLREIQKILK